MNRPRWATNVATVLVAAVAVASLPAAAVGSAGKIPTGRYVGRTSQGAAVTFKFVVGKAIVPQLAPTGPALYDFAATATLRCNKGGSVQRRALFAAAVTTGDGSFRVTGHGTTPSPGESQTFSFSGRLTAGGRGSGTFTQTIANTNDVHGRTCSTGPIDWAAKLASK